MDDILVSHPHSIDAVSDAIAKLHEGAAAAGFEFNGAKSEGPAETIDAFNIRLKHDSLELLPEKFDEFYGRIMQWGLTHSTTATVGYAGTVNVAQAKKLKERLEKEVKGTL